MTDAVYINGSNLELTTTWSAAAGFEHYWTPALKTSFTGTYTWVSYDATAKSYFATNVCATGAQSGFNGAAGTTLATNCNPDWQFFQGGIRTMWTPSPGFFFALSTAWTQIYTAFNGTTVALSPNPVVGARPAGTYAINNQGIFSVMFRAQRNFNAE